MAGTVEKRERLDIGSVEPPLAEKRRRRRESAIIVAAGLAVFIFALWEIRRPGAEDGDPGNVFSFLLVNLNIILLLLLVYLVLRNVLKLVLERRQKVAGSHLRSRLVMAFVAVAVFPAAVMLLISLEFSTNAIDDWFNTEVEDSLRGAWHLAQTYYRESADRAVQHASELAGEVGDAVQSGRIEDVASNKNIEEQLANKQRAFGLGTIQVVDRDGNAVLSKFNRDAPTGLPLGADPQLLADAMRGQNGARVESLGDSDLIRGSAPIYDASGTRIIGAVMVDYLVRDSPRGWSEDILNSFREYRKLKLNKGPFRNLYMLTMALASLVVVFSATWLGLYLARGIADPLVNLADATLQVAEGNWDVELEETGGDEVGTLVRSFNLMTGELKTSHAALDERRRYIENILGNIDAGVVAVEPDCVINTVNPAATSLLGLPPGDVTGRNAKTLFADLGYPEIVGVLEALEEGSIPSGTRSNISREEEGRTLLVIATTLVSASGAKTGFVLFFEDVSQIMGTQRMEAWREVARRIAHEIKNPLTPIQLSAQRMQRKLAGRFEGEDAELIADCTETIVKEVEALKNLVNEFSQFARQPSGEKRPHDLNQLVAETMPLFRSSRPDIEMHFEPGQGLPLVDINREAVKRALINLMDNAIAAVTEDRGGHPEHTEEIVVRTKLDTELSRVRLEVADSGPGVPPELYARVLEPYYSTKADGTGLGLALVASIAADHQAYLRIHDNVPRGARFVIEFPASVSRDTV
jgi:two-component system nitrogen regulation sensor histidine kinase NtrY